MLAYLLAPSFLCVDVNGKPLTGGYIQCLLTGTATQAITYSDFAGTQNANHVSLDAKGMAVIIADSSTALDVYCYNASGVLQWSRLNVTAGAGGGSSQTLIFDPMPTQGSNNPVYSDGIYQADQNEATARAAADTLLQNQITQAEEDIEANAAAIATKLSPSDISAVSPIVKTQLSGNGVQLSHASSGVAAGTYGNLQDVSADFGGSFKTLQTTVDAKGHVTAVSERTITLPNKSVSNFIGGFVCGTLSQNTATQATISKDSGTLSASSSAVTLPAGTYHVTLKGVASTNTAEANTAQALITLSAKISANVFDLFVFKPDANSSGVQCFTHAFDITLSAAASISVWADYETTGAAQGWDMSGHIYIHSVANLTGGGSGGGTPNTAVYNDLDGGTASNYTGAWTGRIDGPWTNEAAYSEIFATDSNLESRSLGYLVPTNAATDEFLGNNGGKPAWKNMAQEVTNVYDANVNIYSPDGSIDVTKSTSGTEISISLSYNPTTSSQLRFIKTLLPAGISGLVAPNHYGQGTNTTYVANGSMFMVDDYITFTTASLFWIGFGNHTLNNTYLAIYQLDNSTSGQKHCILRGKCNALSQTETGIAQFVVNEAFSLDPIHLYYAVIFTYDNGIQFMGNTHTNTNVIPYVSGFKTNITINSVSDIPSTLDWENESTSSFLVVGNRG